LIEHLDNYKIMLRFRDLVTEPGGNIEEHSRLIDEIGYAWWGWWARGQEVVPLELFDALTKSPHSVIDLILFDSGQLEFFEAKCSKIVVAPGSDGINSPDFRATPHYYVRGRYPAWFKLHGGITPLHEAQFSIVNRPTINSNNDVEVTFDVKSAASARDEDATLWLVEMNKVK